MNEGQEKKSARPSCWVVRYGKATASRRTKREAEAFAEWLQARGYTPTVEPFVSRVVPATDRAWQDARLAELAREVNALSFWRASAQGMRTVKLRDPKWSEGDGLALVSALRTIVDRLDREMKWSFREYVRAAERFAGRAVL